MPKKCVFCDFLKNCEFWSKFDITNVFLVKFPFWKCILLCTFMNSLRSYTTRFWHWKSHWKFLWHWKSTETTLKNIYKGNHSDNPGLSYWNIFHCYSRTLKSHWKNLNHTEKFSALLISFVPRFFSVTLDFQCDFQCQYFIVLCYKIKMPKRDVKSPL